MEARYITRLDDTGETMIIARNIMNPDPPHCSLGTTIQEIARRFTEEDISGMLILNDDGRLMSVVTETDLIEQQQNLHIPTAISIFDMVIPLGESRFERELERLQAMTAADLGLKLVKSVTPETGLNEIASLMMDAKVHHLPVVEGDTVVGLISKHDVIAALVKNKDS